MGNREGCGMIKDDFDPPRSAENLYKLYLLKKLADYPDKF